MWQQLRAFFQWIATLKAKRNRRVLNYHWTSMQGDEVIVHEPDVDRNPFVISPIRPIVSESQKTPSNPVTQEPVVEAHPVDRKAAERIVASKTLKAIKEVIQDDFPEATSIARKAAMVEFLVAHPEALYRLN